MARCRRSARGSSRRGLRPSLGGQDVSKIEVAANNKVAEDAEIMEFEMDRQEAEGHFGTSIYDL